MKGPLRPGGGAFDRAAERLSRLSIFDPDAYLADNPDVARAGLDPVAHALTNGIPEGRPVLSDLAMARAYGKMFDRQSRPRPAPPSPPGRVRATVFVHASSDEAYRDLAGSVAADLAALDFDVTLRDETADHRGEHGIAIFVAPHEFFALGRGPLWRDPQILAAGLVVIDDPVGSPAFAGSLPAALAAGGVLDTSAIGTRVWAEAGLPAFRLGVHATVRGRWLEPSDLEHPLVRAASEGGAHLHLRPFAAGERSLDVLFFGRNTPRRDAALSGIAPALSRHRCFIYMPQGAREPAEARLQGAAHWRISGHLCAHSRLTLSLAAAALPCLDRRSAVAQAMAGGSVLVSDVRFAEPGLRDGVHYLREDVRHLGALIDWLLLEHEGRATVDRVRERAFRWIADHNRPSRLDGLRDFIAAAAAGPERDP